MKLSLRLQTIYEMVPYAVTADIGSDHGKLMISLFEDGKIPCGYAVENKKGPYNRLVSELTKAGLVEDIIPLFSDGITDIPEKVQTIIIAGMGGNNIIDILLPHKDKLKNIQTIIVDAHSSIPKVRKIISDIGYIIADEKILKEESIYYEIIKFIKADKAIYSENDYEFGPILRNNQQQPFHEKYEARLTEIDYLLKYQQLPETKIIALEKEKERIIGIMHEN